MLCYHGNMICDADVTEWKTEIDGQIMYYIAFYRREG